MKRLITIIAAICLSTGLAVAQDADTHCYSWEDGGTILSAYLPDLLYVANTDADAFDGSYSLEIFKSDAGGTPQAYVAWITDLQEGDVVTASIMTLDLIPGNPSVRIWGHWTPADGDIDSYAGSAGGNNTYSGSDEYEWIELSHEWTVPADRDGQGLVVEIRPYNSDPYEGSNWVDYLCVTKPLHAFLHFPGDGPVGTTVQSWSGVKSLFQ